MKATFAYLFVYFLILFRFWLYSNDILGDYKQINNNKNPKSRTRLHGAISYYWFLREALIIGWLFLHTLNESYRPKKLLCIPVYLLHIQIRKYLRERWINTDMQVCLNRKIKCLPKDNCSHFKTHTTIRVAVWISASTHTLQCFF